MMICQNRISVASLLGQPGTRALLLLLTLIGLYVTYGFFNFYRDPLSIFFSEKHGFDQFYSLTRQAEANQYLEYLETDRESSIPFPEKAGSNPSICAVFITVGREIAGRQYVDTAIGSFLANLSRAEREEMHLKLFFADVPNPEVQHKSYEALAAANLADDILTYPATLPDRQKERKMQTLERWASDRQNKHALERKTVHDYAYALDRCVKTTDAPYIAIFEGDILLADGWAARTLKDLQAIDKMMAEPTRQTPQRGQVEPGRPSSWLYLRLFNQERSFGWSGGIGFRSNNVHIISLAVGIPLLFVLLLSRRMLLPRHLARHLDGWVMFLVCGVAVPLFVWLFFASGKASLVGAPSGVREEFFGCCNQALVYNRAHAQDLSDFMMAATAKESPGRSDMLPKDFAFEHGLARISAYPMLAQHAGRVSAIDTSSDEARRVWSMAFENFKPSQLALEHQKNVRELFGDDAASDMKTRNRVRAYVPSL
ncbi:hypothetical protein F5Y15DRAFT_336203 [Xylariaceae sp. FL0016]|nr:hypothetical protein F5Y15DRAFT_336203 [Xylariaceae sp. FL0016]